MESAWRLPLFGIECNSRRLRRKLEVLVFSCTILGLWSAPKVLKLAQNALLTTQARRFFVHYAELRAIRRDWHGGIVRGIDARHRPPADASHRLLRGFFRGRIRRALHQDRDGRAPFLDCQSGQVALVVCRLFTMRP